MQHKSMALSTSFARISHSKILENIVASSFIIFAITSIGEINSDAGKKFILDSIRVSVIVIAIIYHAALRKVKISTLLISLVAVLWGIVLGDRFIIDATLGFLVSATIIKENQASTLNKSAWGVIIVTIVTIALSKLGVIESKTFTNTLFNEVSLSTASKESFGFWHPNVASLFVVSCMVCSFLTRSRALLMCSFALYLLVIQETITRTYVPVVVGILFFLFLTKLSSRSEFLFRKLSVYSSLASLSVGLLMCSLGALDEIISESMLSMLDSLLSYRVTIIQRELGSLDEIELVTGVHYKKNQIDSLYANTLISVGLIGLLSWFAVSLMALKKLAEKQKTRELFVFSLFLLISNFESLVSASSLFFVALMVSINSTRYK